MDSIRNKQKCLDNCQQHIFSIRNTEGNNKYDTQLPFCPKFRRDPHPPAKTFPQFNYDKKYYTAAFVLGTDKKSLQENFHQALVHFNTQIRQAQEKNNQVFFPRPNQKHTYCSVCKSHYLNYYAHIQSEEHLERIDAAVYNTEIKKLCQVFRDNWEGAHEQADKSMRRQYQRLQQQLAKQSNSSEESKSIQKKSELEEQSEQQEEDSDSREIEQEQQLLDMKKIDDMYAQKKKSQEMKLRSLIKQNWGKEKKKKKQQEQQQYVTEYLKTSVRNIAPKQKITTRSRDDHKLKKSESDQRQELKIPKKLLSDFNQKSKNTKKTQFLVILRKNGQGKYQIVTSSLEKQQINKSVNHSPQATNKQVNKPKKSHKNVRKNSENDDSVQSSHESANLCDVLRNQWEKKKEMNKPNNPEIQRNSLTPEKGQFQDHANRNMPPYPYYYGYMKAPQNRMPGYPQFQPPPLVHPSNKEGKSPQLDHPNKQANYYPYHVPYQNSWYPPSYMMHPQMMKQHEEGDPNNPTKITSPPNSNINHAQQNFPKYPSPSPSQVYPYGYQNGSNHESYVPYMINQQQHPHFSKQSPNAHSQPQFWYSQPPQMVYNMPMNTQNKGNPQNYSNSKFMGYPYIHNPPNNYPSEETNNKEYRQNK